MMVNANWTRVINQLEPEDWHAILGDAYETLRVLSGGKSICEWASCNFTEAYPPYQILSNDNNRKIIIGKLKALAEKYPDSFKLIRRGPQKAVTYQVPKKNISVRSPYNEERRKRQSQEAKANGLQDYLNNALN